MYKYYVIFMNGKWKMLVRFCCELLNYCHFSDETRKNGIIWIYNFKIIWIIISK